MANVVGDKEVEIPFLEGKDSKGEQHYRRNLPVVEST